ncbi:hypothetical protein ACWEN6_14015 [Sphaerisporangium sp. NPDC004334]
MTTEWTPIRRSIPLLNSEPYRDPDGEHTYLLVDGAQPWLHVHGCAELKHATATPVTGIYRQLTCPVHNLRPPRPCNRCHPHSAHKVTLPDGTDRYRPMGPLATGQHGDQVALYGEYALVDQHNGEWRVREWAADGPSALTRAKTLGIQVILGPRDDRYGLPTHPDPTTAGPQ